MPTIGIFDAKNRLSDLLTRVERGEEFVITRRGKPVAKLVSAKTKPGSAEALEAVRRIRELAKQMNLGPFDWNEWKSYRDEGRR